MASKRLTGGRSVRDYYAFQSAMVRSLLDGEVHHKDDVFRAGVVAVKQFDALSAYQRAHPSQDTNLKGMSGQEKMAEAIRQQAEGARLLVGKAMSHLVDRGLMEVVDTDEKGKRLTYRITDKGRTFVANPEETEGQSKSLQVTVTPLQRKSEMKPCAFCDELLYPNDPDSRMLRMVWYQRIGPQRRSIPADSDIKAYAHASCVKHNVPRGQ